MVSPVMFADKIADLIDEGINADLAIVKVHNEIAHKKVPFKIEKILKEFRKVYNIDPYGYAETRVSNDNVVIDDELLTLFENKLKH